MTGFVDAHTALATSQLSRHAAMTFWKTNVDLLRITLLQLGRSQKGNPPRMSTPTNIAGSQKLRTSITT
jgi:hypothetical protein